jgi:hypothetical protein
MGMICREVSLAHCREEIHLAPPRHAADARHVVDRETATRASVACRFIYPRPVGQSQPIAAASVC